MQNNNLHTTSERILELLYEHDCLIIPGFGAFVSSRVPAQIDTQRGIIIPPRKQIVFNHNLNHNDGVLVAYIADIYSLPLDHANKLVCQYVDQLKLELKNNGIVSIDGVGTFRTFGADICFIPASEANFLMDSFGFEPQPISTQPAAIVRRINNINNFKRVAASVAILISLMMISPETKDAAHDNDYKANIAEAFTQFKNSTVVSNTQTAEVYTSDIEQNTTQTPLNETTPQPTDTYSIIVGSFRTEAEADNYISQMKRQGIDGLVKKPFGQRTRVSAGQFTDRNEAMQNNKAFRNIHGFENAWVLHEKN